jgi:CRISPR-associated protein Csx10
MRETVVTARQGLAIGGPAEVGYDKTTLPYIPGSALRGALAAAWIRDYGPPTPGHPRRAEFIDLFERSTRFGPLLQAGTQVVPLSAVFCKYPTRSDCAGYIADAAVDPDTDRCPHCGAPTATGKGEVEGVHTDRVMRTQLDAQGRAEDGNLFARHELRRGHTYHGYLIGDHPWLTIERQVWLGGKTSTSGRASVRVAAHDTTPHVATSPRRDRALVLRLDSPAIIVDDAGRPSLDPTGEILRVLDLPPDAVTGPRVWTRPVQVGGWHAASGLPKPTEVALAMGSVIVLHLAVPPDPQGLIRLVTQGIGLRRVEGFGMLSVNPPAWRRALTEDTPTPAHQPTLEALRRLRLLDNETTVRWLLDRARAVLVARQRGESVNYPQLFTERVPLYFDDQQAAAVRDLFSGPNLAMAVPMLDHHLDRLTATGNLS